MLIQMQMEINIASPMGIVNAISQILNQLENNTCKAQVLEVYFEDNPEVYNIMQNNIEITNKKE